MYEAPIKKTSKMAHNQISLRHNGARLSKQGLVVESSKGLSINGDDMGLLLVRPLVAEQDHESQVGLEGVHSGGFDVE